MPKYKVKATPRAAGASTLHIEAKDNALYTAPSPINVSVLVENIAKPFANCTPADMQAIIGTGQHTNLWSLGDQMTLVWNGPISDLITFKNLRFDCRIMSMDHNKAISTPGKNNILLKAPYTIKKEQCAFVDPGYMGPETMHGLEVSAGGWENNYANTVTCRDFYNAMPSDMQNVVELATIYTDNVGSGGGSIEANVTPTQNKVFYLAEKEIFGSVQYGNTYEGNYQEQLAAYVNGLGKVHYQCADYNYDSNRNIKAYTWGKEVLLRTTSATNTSYQVSISDDGAVKSVSRNYYSYGATVAWYIAA